MVEPAPGNSPQNPFGLVYGDVNPSIGFRGKSQAIPLPDVVDDIFFTLPPYLSTTRKEGATIRRLRMIHAHSSVPRIFWGHTPQNRTHWEICRFYFDSIHLRRTRSPRDFPLAGRRERQVGQREKEREKKKESQLGFFADMVH